MAFIQVREVMKKSCRDHKMVAEFFDDLLDSVDDVKLRYLLSNMKNHEDKMAHCIQEYLKVKNSTGLNTWLQYLPDMKDITSLLDPNCDLDEETIVKMVREIQNAFIENYDKMTHVNLSDTVTDIFIDMKNFSDHDAHRDGWKSIMMNDM
ncbi:MAG: hypothetical protein NE328_14275 [Lentisphaeraceae bacterium]|nr:hypothetical protein [Lentisphaeraceae bacterium]